MRTSRAILSLVVLTWVWLFCTCIERHQTSSSAESADIRNLSDLMRELVPEGLAIVEPVGFFTAENLYERINGRAELYLAYDVVNLTTATFEDKADMTRFVELSVFDMGSTSNAFGIFSVERFPGEPPLDLGRLSYSSEANIYVWKGRYYITVVVSDSEGGLRHVGLNMARMVTGFLSDSGEPVWGLTAFPVKDLIRDSIRYFKVDAMGLDFMRNVYTAEYRRGDTSLTVFLSRQADPEAAQGMVERYAAYSQEYGRGYTRIDRNGVNVVICDMGGVFDAVSQKNRLVIGATSVKNREAAIREASTLRDALSDPDDIR